MLPSWGHSSRFLSAARNLPIYGGHSEDLNDSLHPGQARPVGAELDPSRYRGSRGFGYDIQLVPVRDIPLDLLSQPSEPYTLTGRALPSTVPTGVGPEQRLCCGRVAAIQRDHKCRE